MQSIEDISALFDIYKTSVFHKDVDTLMTIYDEAFVGFDMWGAWSHVGEGAWRELNQKWLGSLGTEKVVVDFDDVTTLLGVEISAAHATVTYKAVSEADETLRSMQNRLTWVVRRSSGSWKIVHQHTSAPIDPSTMTARLRR